jgi:hypothetical protein
LRRAPHTVMLIAASMVLSTVSSADRLHGRPGAAPYNRQLADLAGTSLSFSSGLSSAIVISSGDVDGVVGKEVRSSTGENMGRIVEVVVDRSGQVRAAVMDFGGFLGVGNRKIAVDWNLLQFDTVGDPQGRLTLLKLTPDQVRAAPEYKPGKAVVIVSALGDAASWQLPSSAPLER